MVLVDDIFTTDNDWAAAVCEEIIRRDPDVAWTCTNGIRVDSANDELFTLMKRAGCYRVYFGFETGNDEVLKAFGKGGRATLDQGSRRGARWPATPASSPTASSWSGSPGDTEATMQDTIDYARQRAPRHHEVRHLRALPGHADVPATCTREGRIKTLDWDAYTVYNEADGIFDHPDLELGDDHRLLRPLLRRGLLQEPRVPVATAPVHGPHTARSSGTLWYAARSSR